MAEPGGRDAIPLCSASKRSACEPSSTKVARVVSEQRSPNPHTSIHPTGSASSVPQ